MFVLRWNQTKCPVYKRCPDLRVSTLYTLHSGPTVIQTSINYLPSNLMIFGVNKINLTSPPLKT